MAVSSSSSTADTEDADGPAEILLPQDMLKEFPAINVCAPMVRYSKLPFRQLVAQHACHITYTPMFLAQEFSRSAVARDADFSTNQSERATFYIPEASSSTLQDSDSVLSSLPERPISSNTVKRRGRKVRGALFVQFAAKDGAQLADAAELVRPWVDGVDLNCGCPQSWAYKDGVGCALLRKPQLVHDLVRETKNRLGWEFPVTVKIRLDADPKNTEALVRNAIAGGADILTIHGRTRHQSSSGTPVDLDGIAFARSFARGEVPVMGNGDIFTQEDADEMRRRTGVSGVMSARGLLANPALFEGFDKTPLSVIQEFMKISTSCGLMYPLFHRHLSYMLECHLTRRSSRTHFNSLVSHAAVYDYLEENFGI